MPKHVFGTQNPKLGLFTIFKSHLKRSLKVLTFLNRLRMMPNRVFSTQNHKWGLFTIFKTHLKRSSKSFKISKSTQNDDKTYFWYSKPEIRTFQYFQKSS